MKRNDKKYDMGLDVKMNITFTLSLEEYKALLSRFAKANLFVKSKRMFNNFFPPIVAFIVSFSTKPHSFMAAIVFGVIAVIIWIPLNSFIRAKRIHKIYKKANLHLSKSVGIEQDGVHIVNAISSSIISWNGIENLYDDQQFIYFMTSKTHGIFIPKSAFATASDAAGFLLQAQFFLYKRK